jgi:tRNA(fMet)-specific endonuclease VapC
LRLTLDTSAYSHFRRGDADVVTAVSTASWIGVPAIVLGELRSGFLQGSRPEQNLSELAAFLRHAGVHVQDVDSEAASLYAGLVGDLRRAGTPVPTNDLWIASVALRDGATVATFDGDFLRIRSVGVRLFRAAT